MNKYFTSFCFVILFFPVVIGAVYFAVDSVTLLENGNKINDELTLWAADYGYGDLCPNGICNIGQQFYPVTIYRLKTLTIQSFGQFKETPGSKQGIEFHKYLKENSYYQTTLQPPKSEGGGEGRIGNYRAIDFDIRTNKLTITSEPPPRENTTKELTLPSGLLIVFVFGLLMYKFWKLKNKKPIS